MLVKSNVDPIAVPANSIGVQEEASSRAALLHTGIGFARRQFWVVLCSLILALCVGGLYLFVTRPTYTASATMLIDSRRGGVQQKSVLGDTPATDSSWIDSRLGMLLLERDKIGLAVADRLRLAKRPEIFEPDDGFLQALTAPIMKLFGSDGPQSEVKKTEQELTQQAAGVVAGGLDVKRIGFTYLVNINFSSHNQELARSVANAAADAFVVAELNSKYEGLRQASDWLQERYQTLRDQASAADRAVVEFKGKNKIITAGGKLINDQQLTEINNRLGIARGASADRQARLDQIETVLREQETKGTVDTTVPDALVNPIITKLRTQYLDLVNKEADWSKRFGKDHLAVVNLRNQARDIRNSTHEELKRIAESYKSELEISKKNEEELEKQLDSVLAQVPNDAQIALRGLETTAQSYRTFYDNFFQNYTDSVQQQSSPIPETRVVAYAPWAGISHPLISRVILFTLLGGMGLGIGFGALREALDRSLRTVKQVRTELQVDCVALIPLVKNSRPRRFSAPVQLINKSSNKNVNCRSAHLFRLIQDAPFSRFAEAIRAIKLAADLRTPGNSGRVIGITSSLPREGKSTIAAALAQLTAQVGARVILIDCDLRNPALSRSLVPTAHAGIIDVLSEPASLDQVIWTDPHSGLSFLPAGKVLSLANTTHILGGDAMKRLFEILRSRYDYVIVDLSPLSPVVDVRATTSLFDFYVFLIEWGVTQVDVVQQALKDAQGVFDNMLGVVLNKVDTNRMARYEAYRAPYYRNKYFSRYGYVD